MLSRVADSCYWMARYLERAEHTARLLAVRTEAMVEQGETESDEGWRRLLLALVGPEDAAKGGEARDIAFKLSFDRACRNSIYFSYAAARENARQVREQISSEMWERINREYLRLNAMRFDPLWDGSPAQSFRAMIDAIHLIKGITNATMSHGEGYHFIELGRHMERAQLMCELLDVYFGGETARSLPGIAAPKYFDWINLLKQCSGFEAYCKAYTANIVPEQIAEFLIFDEGLPHALRFTVDKIESALHEIAPGAPQSRRAAVMRRAGRLKALVDYAAMDEIKASGIGDFLNTVQRQCIGLHEAVYTSFVTYRVEDVLRSA